MKADKQRLYFVNEILTALTLDHNARHSQGMESGRFVRKTFEKELEGKYPKVGTGELLNTARKTVRALEADPSLNRGMDFEKVDCLMKFIFKTHGASKWPTVVETVKTFADGKFAHYAEGTKTDDESEAEAILRLLGNVSNGPSHIRLLRVFVEETINNYKLTLNMMENDKKRIRALEARERDIKIAASRIVEAMQGREDLSEEDQKTLEEAKKMLQ